MTRVRASAPGEEPDDEITELLGRMSRGEAGAAERVFTALYDHLRAQARAAMARQPSEHTLQPTALVNEAFLKLLPQSVKWTGRSHFLAVAAKAMRCVLVDHARAKRRRKRKTPGRRVELDALLDAFEQRSGSILALHAAIERMKAIDPLAAQIVELRFFGGLPFPVIARMLGVPLRTVERKWAWARRWLRAELS